MKKLIIIFMLLIPVVAYAEQCVDIEYAELKDMSQESFDKEYCKVTLLYESNIHDWMEDMSHRAEKDMKSCEILSDKMKRIYEAKFKTTPNICTEAGQRKKAKDVWPDRIE